MRRRAGAVSVGLALLLAGAAMAQSLGGLASGNDGQPIAIEAERGIEWRQADKAYVARGNVKITRGTVTIEGETVTAYYRSTGRAAPEGEDGVLGGGGSTEIYRMLAEGEVRIRTESQVVYGDRAVYDLDQALAVVTGRNVRLETPTDTVTARDSLEWYDKTQLAVARGNAVAIREDKRVKADILMAQVVRPETGPSRVSRVDAHGNVLVSTLNEIARGAAGVYNVDTGIATLSGNVSIARGDNTLRGQYGVVDLNNNVSRLLSGPPSSTAPTGGRVEGLLVPRPAAKP